MISAVPVKGHSGDHFFCFTVNGFHRPFIKPFLIMIPDVDFNFIQPMFFQRRIKSCFQKLPLLLCTVQAGIPFLYCVGLVLNGHSFYRKSLCLQGKDVLADIFSPVRIVFPFQMSAPLALSVCFHIFRRRPGRNHDLRLLLTDCKNIFKHWKNIFSRSLDRHLYGFFFHK